MSSLQSNTCLHLTCIHIRCTYVTLEIRKPSIYSIILLGYTSAVGDTLIGTIFPPSAIATDRSSRQERNVPSQLLHLQEVCMNGSKKRGRLKLHSVPTQQQQRVLQWAKLITAR